ncbi:ATP-binding protein [Paracoccus sp. S-4012]|uniref:ATP-binding protein n=1 Tax=Paracoccus sp. S-4012 TaxID=2665648 RepID=UPI00351B4F90
MGAPRVVVLGEGAVEGGGQICVGLRSHGHAARREMSLRETLAWLLAAEIGHREERRMRMATGIAKFPFVRTLEGFDFSAQPSLDPGQVRDLAACRWIANGDALLVLGPPGVGKTHLAVGLGREAIRLGYSDCAKSAAPAFCRRPERRPRTLKPREIERGSSSRCRCQSSS